MEETGGIWLVNGRCFGREYSIYSVDGVVLTATAQKRDYGLVRLDPCRWECVQLDGRNSEYDCCESSRV